MAVSQAPAPALRGLVSGYYGWRERTLHAVRRREGPGTDVVVVLSFDEEWLIDGRRLTSFVAGLHDRQVTTEHGGRSYGMQVNLAPPAARVLFDLPLHSLAGLAVPLEEVVDEPFLVERLHGAGSWDARFRLLDAVLTKRFAGADEPSPEVDWAWRQLVEAESRAGVGALANELGWSRKRIVARFRDEVGLPPKALARVARFERAKRLAEAEERPNWARIAVESGYYDQSHLSNEFRRITGRTPATFFQDAVPDTP
jgi:AraC-like DNA-binding protein